MSTTLDSLRLDIFSTCPPSSDVDRDHYLQAVVDVARWSERHGCKGILVYTDSRLVDPWLVSQIIVQNTASLSPLVAVQPIYMHPYSVAKMVASIGHLHGRRLYLNMVAGGFKNDLTALHDPTPHDKRYDRLREYTLIIKQLLAGGPPVRFAGEFYQLDGLRLSPPLPEGLFPGFFVSGSSAAGLAAARAIGAVAVKYPEPGKAEAGDPGQPTTESGIRVGIIARAAEDDAWRLALSRFPEERKGQLTHQLAMKVSDSVWHKQLSELGRDAANGPWWLTPFQNYKTFCPYLVGSYGRVAGELARFIAAGQKTFILDIPADEEELHHTTVAFTRALEAVPR